MRGLYAIVDAASLCLLGIDPILYAKALLSARPAALQFRAKQWLPREALALLRALHPLCRHVSVPLIAHERVDLALLSGCEMVHLGQKDGSIDRVRRLAPNLGIGISAHSLTELDDALRAGPSYVVYGPIFADGPKPDRNRPIGLSELRIAAAMAAACRIPLVATGEINLERATEVAHLVCAAASSGEPPIGLSDERADGFDRVTARATTFHAILGCRRSRPM